MQKPSPKASTPAEKPSKPSSFKGPNESEKVTFNFDKSTDFSEWFTQIINRAELADIRYGVKGFLVFQPWSVLTMEKMYSDMETELQSKNHLPHWFPVVIPEKNFHLEAEHVEGFTPQVFWVTETGDEEPLEERLALRPTSETAFYQMFSIWIRSYNDLPYKTYQRAAVYRHETKATRPFLRSREFHWIETHCCFVTAEDALAQVREDMQTTERVLHQQWGIPFIFFERPQWDKFAGADSTFAADTLMPDGRVLQLPSTHLLGQHFTKVFNVTYTDENNQPKHPYSTCYGPAISRIYAALFATHGDNKGLRFPFDLAPVQILIVPIAANKNPAVVTKAHELAGLLRTKGLRVKVDDRNIQPGEKFYHWEMKGVPIRIEIGPRELDNGALVVYRRDNGAKETIDEKALDTFISKTAPAILSNLRLEADEFFKDAIHDADSMDAIKSVIEKKGFARVNFCTLEKQGVACATVVEKELGGNVRGKRFDKNETPKGNCVICGKPAEEVVYVGKQY